MAVSWQSDAFWATEAERRFCVLRVRSGAFHWVGAQHRIRWHMAAHHRGPVHHYATFRQLSERFRRRSGGRGVLFRDTGMACRKI
jgi:hypothetical protein